LCQSQIIVFRPVFADFKRADWLREVSLRGQSVRMTEGSVRARDWGTGSLKKFWRIRGIASLVGYPEKTDRLEQRQAAGKTPWPLFDL
jgi:hypothetical protein